MDWRHLSAIKDTTSSGSPVKAPSPMAQYTFNGNAQDMTGHGLNGTVTGPVLTTDNQGNAANAYHFDGVNDVIRLANTKDSLAFIQNTAVFTITAFVKLDDLNARSVFVSSTGTQAAKGFLFMYENVDATSGLHQLRFSTLTGTNGRSVLAKGAQNTIKDTHWHHVAVVGNGTSIQFYVDGVADGAPTSVKYLSTGTSAKDAVIGAIPDATTNAITLPYKGAIDEVNIFKTALSAEEIKHLAQRTPVDENPVASDIYVNEDGYRYGFSGKEKDDNGEFGNTHYDYGFRIYNPSIARFLSVDPLTGAYPWYTPYQFAGNNPIWAIDLDGLEEKKVNPAQQRANAGKKVIQNYIDNGVTYSNPNRAFGLDVKCADCSSTTITILREAGQKNLLKEVHTGQGSGGGIQGEIQKKEGAQNLKDPYRSTNPKVGDLMMWKGHITVVTDVSDGQFQFAHMGNSGPAIAKIKADLGDAATIKEKVQKWSPNFWGFWTPPNSNGNADSKLAQYEGTVWDAEAIQSDIDNYFKKNIHTVIQLKLPAVPKFEKVSEKLEEKRSLEELEFLDEEVDFPDDNGSFD